MELIVLFEVLRAVIVVAVLYIFFARRNNAKNVRFAMNAYLISFGLLLASLMYLIAKMVFSQ
ncbi:hypothetical protein F8154_06220 [Alkaliphilus pronyensis]|uniref:Uncharacterized protein n=1 Tax=Alkaliphilus pronyensis TaxID=1482732 RepID=A0A6I0EZH5_9FIRM|nr:hypothetical protein F8154_06220 [Alkaliphilus pronyensis]